MKVTSRFLLITGLICTGTACTALPATKPPTDTFTVPLDTSFGIQGVVTFSGQNNFVPLVLQSTDKIVGYTFDSTKPEGEQTHQLARLNIDGSFDSSFIPGVIVGVSPENEIIKLPDDSLIRLEFDFAKATTRVTKYSADGVAMISFGKDSSLNLPFVTRGAKDTCVNPKQGDIVLPVAASPALTDIPQGQHLFMAKITADGQMPGEYGFKQKFTSTSDATHCVVTASGDIIIGSIPNEHFANEIFDRFSSDGTRDLNYSVRLASDGPYTKSTAIALDQDDRLLVVSKDGMTGRSYFGRLTATGMDDSSFNWTAFGSSINATANPRIMGFKTQTGYRSVNYIFPLANKQIAIVGNGLKFTQFKPNGDLETQFNKTGQFVIDEQLGKSWAALTSTGQLFAFSLESKTCLYKINLAP